MAERARCGAQRGHRHDGARPRPRRRVRLDRERAVGWNGRAGPQPAAGADLDDRQSLARRARAAAAMGWTRAWDARHLSDRARQGDHRQRHAVRMGGELDWRPALCVQYAAAGLLFAFGAAVFETGVVDWTPQFLFALGWLVLVLSFGAVWLLYFLIRRVPVTRVASLFYLTPPVTALMAWALFNERLAPRALLGMAVCLLGVFLVNRKSKEI